MDDRRFTDDEVDEILRLASERQEGAESNASTGASTGASKPAPRTEGTSLAALQAVGSDVGIDPRHILAAAREVELADRTGHPGSRLGIPLEIGSTRILPGPVGDAAWEQMVDHLRDEYGRKGIASEYGRVREWISTDPGRLDSASVRLRLEGSGSQGTVSLRQDADQLSKSPAVLAVAFGGMAPVLLVLGALLGFEPAVWITASFFATVGATLGFGGLALGKRKAEARRRRIEAALDRITLIARDQIEEGRDS